MTTTTYLKLQKPPFDDIPWDDAVNGNMDIIDAFSRQFMSIVNFVGAWTNTTSYVTGQNVLDITNGIIYTVQITHTSSDYPTTFADDRTTNPTFWTQFLQVISIGLTDLAISNNAVIGGTLNVGGATTLGAALNVTGPTTFASGTVAQAGGTSAAAGYVGEYREVTLSVPSLLVSGSTSNVTGVTLPAGDWEVRGLAVTSPAVGTLTSYIAVGLTATSGVLPTPPAAGGYGIRTTPNTAPFAGSAASLAVGPTRFNLAVSTLIYIVAQVSFSAGTLGIYGYIGARRIR